MILIQRVVNADGYDYPTVTTNADREMVCIGQAWQYAYVVGNMDVSFDKDGVVSSCSGDATLLIGDSFKQKDANGTKVEVDANTKAENNESVTKLPSEDHCIKSYKK